MTRLMTFSRSLWISLLTCLAEANAYVADGDTKNVISSISTEGLRLMSVLSALLPPGNALELHVVVVRRAVRAVYLQIVSRHF